VVVRLVVVVVVGGFVVVIIVEVVDVVSMTSVNIVIDFGTQIFFTLT